MTGAAHGTQPPVFDNLDAGTTPRCFDKPFSGDREAVKSSLKMLTCNGIVLRL
ncbi:hypothetical protein I546_5316 [Mycobacterium kansasii 732]|uniref:Uncharacterized protein n=1 Tax=Mycobacterium pseudokansasii TaxID=2341080 RepID=A0A498QX85_9MYCO|nr:hypothetical protein I546_5316 [Mycobacterium kansasii 732]VBA30603.1 hypothetical protein LAUMK35_04788 [Mycobacterium pseudokansasii]VBA32410.1 hypothetical protein LAUMK21_04780 [Mycobacterium pseudokansasii]VBA54495.1 hypothetical protein LAUMK142_04689 [Mycobacterium pseudokansasii]